MRVMILLGAASAVALLLLGGCSSATDNSQVAAGPGDPVATTPPFAVPPVLRQPDRAQDVDPNAPVATTAPIAAPAPPATERVSVERVPTPSAVSFDDPDPLATAAQSSPPAADEVLAATAGPAREPAAPTGTTVPAGTTAPAGSTPLAQAVVPGAAAAPAQSTGGPTISLGDFEVVNLITQQNQNIAELSPNGATMLWFWAPH